jgi:hypothetical protein
MGRENCKRTGMENAARYRGDAFDSAKKKSLVNIDHTPPVERVA